MLYKFFYGITIHFINTARPGFSMGDLELFHNYLHENCPGYCAMIAIGSWAVGDQWIEGRSDRDTLLLFNQDFTRSIPLINKYIEQSNFDDTYMFVPLLKEYLLRNKKHSHDFSGKFRSKVLFGEDIIPLKQLPDRETTLNIIQNGFWRAEGRISRTLLNEALWSDEKIRSVLWKEFKHAIMYLAIKQYYDTGVYPPKRIDLVEASKSNVLAEVVRVLYAINTEERTVILSVASTLLKYLGGRAIPEEVKHI